MTAWSRPLMIAWKTCLTGYIQEIGRYAKSGDDDLRYFIQIKNIVKISSNGLTHIVINEPVLARLKTYEASLAEHGKSFKHLKGLKIRVTQLDHIDQGVYETTDESKFHIGKSFDSRETKSTENELKESKSDTCAKDRVKLI